MFRTNDKQTQMNRV